MTAIILLASYIIYEMNYDKGLAKYKQQVKSKKSVNAKHKQSLALPLTT